MITENPNLEWYKKISAKNKVNPRCPYANLYKCPIYFQSITLLRNTGATKLDENEGKKFIKFWEDSGLNSLLLEETPSVILGNEKKFSSLSNFCPEVTFLRFGYFASYLSEFADGTDRAIRHYDLSEHNVQDSWRWQFEVLRAKHYTDCRLYSILSSEKSIKESKNDNLTSKQRSDYNKYDYKCYDHIYSPGTSSISRSNEIIVNEIKIKIRDSLFLLLLRLAVELKKGEGAWVNIYSLYDEHIIADLDKYQIYSRLRTAIKGSLIARDGEKFIENDGSKNYRLSIHPDFITYNKEKLLTHKDSRSRKLAEELPSS